MSSTKFQKLAKKIAVRDKAIFDSLIEFENTGKIRTKTRMNFTIDKDIASKFKKYCKDKGINMSAKIEKLMDNLSNM